MFLFFFSYDITTFKKKTHTRTGSHLFGYFLNLCDSVLPVLCGNNLCRSNSLSGNDNNDNNSVTSRSSKSSNDIVT